MISNVLRAGLMFEYLTFDLWYNARSFTKWLDAQEITWVSTLKGNVRVTFRGRTQPVAELAPHLPRHSVNTSSTLDILREGYVGTGSAFSRVHQLRRGQCQGNMTWISIHCRPLEW